MNEKLRNLFFVINDLRMASLAKLAQSLVRLPSVHFKQFCLKFDLRYSHASEGHGCFGFHTLKKGREEMQTFKICIFDTVEEDFDCKESFGVLCYQLYVLESCMDNRLSLPTL